MSPKRGSFGVRVGVVAIFPGGLSSTPIRGGIPIINPL